MPFKEDYLDYPNGFKVRIRINKYLNRTLALHIHDTGERLELFDFMFPYFDEYDIALNSIELRGHGLSYGKKKHIDSFEEYLTDMRRFILGHLGNKEIYIIGQGTSAVTAARLAEDNRFKVKGLIMISPLLDYPIHSVLKHLIPLISVVSPETVLKQTVIDPSSLTSDNETAGLLADEIKRTRDGLTAGFMKAFYREAAKMFGCIHLLRKIPLLLMLGENDPLLNTEKVISAFSGLYKDTDNLTVSTRKKCSHSMLLEKNRIDIVSEIIKWIMKKEAETKKAGSKNHSSSA